MLLCITYLSLDKYAMLFLSMQFVMIKCELNVKEGEVIITDIFNSAQSQGSWKFLDFL